LTLHSIFFYPIILCGFALNRIFFGPVIFFSLALGAVFSIAFTAFFLDRSLLLHRLV
jgi:hypothetical protein